MISTQFVKSAKGCKHETLPFKPFEYHVWSEFFCKFVEIIDFLNRYVSRYVLNIHDLG